MANRRQFTSDLETSFPVPKGHKLALMLLDLDDFKPVNDTLGHGAGDVVLKMTAERIQEILRDG
ncbi:diguanylate cyclase domain-containing protein [Rhizobium croatiense]|uniref:diguanylate cyclase domain-containing protein n=1 Tax=Rhizobium croatiense TaxID=2867516 RepID=UPI00248BC8B9|nr:diguanylate cyclase [Rhizobium croatiense]